MGLSFGTQSGSTNSSTTADQSNQYGAGQSGLQDMLGKFFQSMIPSMTSGQLSPATAAVTTGNADQINKNYATVGSDLQSKLAARGMGGSGQSGQTTLQTELGRQGAQAGNLEAGGASQLQQNNADLLSALNYAFTSLGSAASGTQSGTSKGSQFGGSVSGSLAFPV